MMKCREVKRELALYLGHDGTSPSRWEQVRRHLSVCGDCRAHAARLKETLAVVERAEAPSTYEIQGSVWPELQARLDNPRPARDPRRFSNWIPLASVAVACLLFVTVWTASPEPAPQGQLEIGRQAVAPFAQWPQHDLQKSHEAREAEKRARAEQPKSELPAEL